MDDKISGIYASPSMTVVSNMPMSRKEFKRMMQVMDRIEKYGSHAQILQGYIAGLESSEYADDKIIEYLKPKLSHLENLVNNGKYPRDTFSCENGYSRILDVIISNVYSKKNNR